MDTQKLAKALKKELTRNPKKTIALGLATVVALWFWAPLAVKWFGGGKSKAKRAAIASVATPSAASTPPSRVETAVVVSAKTSEMNIDWNELLRRISRDEHMQTVRGNDQLRDPFATTAVETQLTQNAAEQVPGSVTSSVMQTEPTPADSGLVLQGTLVSLNRQRAVIAGRTYGIGDRVLGKPPVNSDPGSTASDPIEFELAEIEPTRVVLIRKNKPYELRLARETLAEGDRLSFGDPR